MKQRKIAYISGTRADFGLMSPVLSAIEKHPNLKLQLYATGVHLMPEFGNTIEHIRAKFPDVKQVKTTFNSDNRLGMAQFAGDYLQKVVPVFQKNRPDLILVLGDRVEMLCTALAAVYLGIPLAHIHGGEKTSTVDEISRHSITKLSSLHFTASKDAAKRIRRLGEDPWRIYVVGAPALDVILKEKLPTRKELFTKLGIDPNKQVIIVTQHPVSEQTDQAYQQMETTLEAVKTFSLPTVITYPHPDTGGRKMILAIEKEAKNPLFHIFPSLEFTDWLALEREAAVWVGNSSAGIIESASFKTPVVNIGERQKGRPQNGNVLNVSYNKDEIEKAIKKSLFDKNYLAKLKKIKNIWGNGKASSKIVKVLSKIDINDKLLNKQITY